MNELTLFRWNFPVLNVEAAQEVFPLDVPPDKTYQQVWIESRNPDDFNHMHQVTRDAFLNDKPFYRNVFRCTDKHGVEHWMQEFITIHKLGENHWHLFGINTDITDLKKSEVRLAVQRGKIAAVHRATGTQQPRAAGFRLRRLARPPGTPPQNRRLRRTSQGKERRNVWSRIAGLSGSDAEGGRADAGPDQRAAVLLPGDHQGPALQGRSIWPKWPPAWWTIWRAGLNWSRDASRWAPCRSSTRNRVQMRQLLQNLIGNALKFRRPEEPPVVKVDAEIIPDPAAPDIKFCRLTVSDNCIGFDEKYVDRIFNVFQRLHTRNEYEGTGMGLAIVRKIALYHDGDITAKSKPGEGSTFILTVPGGSGQKIARRNQERGGSNTLNGSMAVRTRRETKPGVMPDQNPVNFRLNQQARALISRFCHCATSFRFGRMAFHRQWLWIWLALVLSSRTARGRHHPGRPRLRRRHQRVPGRHVEPRGDGVRQVRPEVSGLRPRRRGGVVAGGGGIQAGKISGSHHAARPAQGRGRGPGRPVCLLDWRSAVSRRGPAGGGGNLRGPHP